MKRFVMYLLFYSVGGWVLERILNLIFLGYWWDNSVLYGPYQPLYGNGVVLTILFAEFVLPRINVKKWVKTTLFIIAAILFTGLSEVSTGYLYQWATGIHLWDYGQTFPCKLEYVCILPTSLFGISSFFVVKYLHPIFKQFLDKTPKWLYYFVSVLFLTDIIFTLIKIF